MYERRWMFIHGNMDPELEAGLLHQAFPAALLRPPLLFSPADFRLLPLDCPSARLSIPPVPQFLLAGGLLTSDLPAQVPCRITPLHQSVIVRGTLHSRLTLFYRLGISSHLPIHKNSIRASSQAIGHRWNRAIQAAMSDRLNGVSI